MEQGWKVSYLRHDEHDFRQTDGFHFAALGVGTNGGRDTFGVVALARADSPGFHAFLNREKTWEHYKQRLSRGTAVQLRVEISGQVQRGNGEIRGMRQRVVEVYVPQHCDVCSTHNVLRETVCVFDCGRVQPRCERHTEGSQQVSFDRVSAALGISVKALNVPKTPWRGSWPS